MKITPENYRDYLPEGYSIKINHLSFDHEEFAVTPFYFSLRKFGTRCMIFDKDNKIKGFGESICHPKDIPNKRIGWEIAVGRAFKNAGLI